MQIKKLVLIVDDQEDIRALYRFLLEEEGYEVREAANGEEALAVANREDPDIILMDLDMPVLSGLDSTALLRQVRLTHDVPVIAVTGQAIPDTQRLKDSGFSGYLPKDRVLEGLYPAVTICLRQVEDGTDWVELGG